MPSKKVGKAVGVCGVCGQTLTRDRPADIAYCDCYRYCPNCGRAMTPYTPDLNGKNYDPERGLKVLFVCTNHSPPYYSTQKPVEVQLL